MSDDPKSHDSPQPPFAPRPDRPPLSLLEPEIIRAIASRLQLSHLLKRYPERPLWALFMFINGFVTIGLLAGVSMLTQTPSLFPSLGPTAFLFFFSPSSPTSSPRHSLLGHAIGIFCGYASLCLFGLQDAQPALIIGVDAYRTGAVALSLAGTGALMILLKAAHPPAGATTMIISLGLMTKPTDLLVIELAVGILVLQAIAINRLAGLDYPLWARCDDDKSKTLHVQSGPTNPVQ